jgi:hypothetical protein
MNPETECIKSNRKFRRFLFWVGLPITNACIYSLHRRGEDIIPGVFVLVLNVTLLIGTSIEIWIDRRSIKNKNKPL